MTDLTTPFNCGIDAVEIDSEVCLVYVARYT